jgi:uncharacterized protein (DUF1499 family)
MKFIIFTAATLVILIGVILIGFSIASRKQPELGLNNGQLQPCPATPNCVCSEYQVEDAYIEPFTYTSTSEQAWARVKRVIAETGGVVISETADYLHVVYETPLLRYRDDVEFRLDKNNQQIQVRSASRVGRSDMGTNRKRVEKIWVVFERLG